MEKSESTGSWAVFKKQFPKGAKVQLNAGGPVMAVKDHFEDNKEIRVISGPSQQDKTIVCQWFSGKKLEIGYFAPETLVLVKDDAKEEHS